MNPSAYPHIQRRERLFNLATMRTPSHELRPGELVDAVESPAAVVEPLPAPIEADAPVAPAS
jgi:hypothetical protein